jgi:hypothetical protein
VPEYALAELAILHRLSYLMLDFIELNNFVIDGSRMFNIVHPPNLNQFCFEFKILNSNSNRMQFVRFESPSCTDCAIEVSSQMDKS